MLLFNGYDCEWIDVRVEWQKNVNVDDLDVGYVFEGDKGLMEGLFRGCYSYLEYATCPNCGTEDTMVQEIYKDVFGCDYCEDKLTPKDINNPRKLKK